jgi:eukaryotic-like serine/threonine-protein kinase
MGEVYRATDSLLGRAVAVKLLAERHAKNPDVRARFKREALAAAQLSTHRHVVTVFDVGEHDGRPFIVMEYLAGGSVYDRLRVQRVDTKQALDWLAGAGGALDAAHARGIVHRDVKPANLLLDDADSVHVTDFGIAFAAGLDTLTVPGTVLGTAGYMAPEQARGEPATAATDRYALGVVAFELLTGRRPFAADTPVTEAFAHLNADVPSATRLEPALPARVDAVLERALAKDPSDRPRSSKELVAELCGAFEEDASPTLVQPPPPPSPPATRRHQSRGPRPVAYALVAAGVLAAGLAGAAFVEAVGDDPSQRTRTDAAGETAPPPTPTTEAGDSTGAGVTTTPPSETRTSVDGAELNDEGFSRMQAGDFQGALPLLERAVAALSGSGELPEAWASYNLAYTRFALGACGGLPELLDRSEAVQGRKKDIDRLRRDVEKECFEDGRGRDNEGRGNDDDD